MNDNLTAAVIAAALLLTGTLTGICLSSVADGATTVTVVTPSAATVTAPAVTITATVRVTERASRSHSRGTSPASLPTSRTTSEGTRGGLPASDARVSDYQTYARARVPADQWPCLRTLWQRESGWDPTQRTGSHYGIAQRKGETNTDYRRQIVLGLSYIAHRYDGPCDALQHSNRNGWY